eukprot:2801672-Prymnesium_polylepis.1
MADGRESVRCSRGEPTGDGGTLRVVTHRSEMEAHESAATELVSWAMEYCEEESQFVSKRFRDLLEKSGESQEEALLSLRLEVKQAFSALVSVLDVALEEAVASGTDPNVFDDDRIRQPIESRKRQRLLGERMSRATTDSKPSMRVSDTTCSGLEQHAAKGIMERAQAEIARRQSSGLDGRSSDGAANSQPGEFRCAQPPPDECTLFALFHAHHCLTR